MGQLHKNRIVNFSGAHSRSDEAFLRRKGPNRKLKDGMMSNIHNSSTEQLKKRHQELELKLKQLQPKIEVDDFGDLYHQLRSCAKAGKSDKKTYGRANDDVLL